ncbi:MAG: Tyrosine recombinase XerD, partial [Bacteroidota bacterium]
MSQTKLQIQKVNCNGQMLIGIPISGSQNEWREKIKTIAGRRWHENEFIWTIPHTTEAFQTLKKLFGADNIEVNTIDKPIFVTPPQYRNRNLPLKEGIVKKEGKHNYRPLENHILFDKLNPKQQKAVSKLEELLIEERKAYETIKGYRNIIIPFLGFYSDILPSQISKEQIRAYILKKIKEGNISKSTQNHYVSTFKAFYGRLLHQYDKVEDLFRPENDKSLP